MDGVLFDSESIHARSWEDVVGPLGLSLPDNWFLPWIGIPDFEMAKHFNVTLSDYSSESLLAAKRKRYLEIMPGALVAYPGILAQIRQLSAMGMPIAVATSGTADVAAIALCSTGILPLLTALVTIDDVARPKPAPDCYLLAADRLGRPADRCSVIEDSPSGIESARNAGCRVLAVVTSMPQAALSGADRLFDSTFEALDFLIVNVI